MDSSSKFKKILLMHILTQMKDLLEIKFDFFFQKL